MTHQAVADFGRLLVFAAAIAAPLSCARADDRLFVIAGQSNAISAGGVIDEGSGLSAGTTMPKTRIWKNEARTPSFVVMRLGENTVQYPAKTEQYANFGPEWGMSEAYAETFRGEGVRFFKFARGKTSLLNEEEWSPTGPSSNLYGQMLVHLRALAEQNMPAACFVWVQGEADRAKDVDVYEAAFRRFLSGAEKALGQTELKVVWPRLSQARGSSEAGAQATERFRAMQVRIAGDPTLRVRLIDVDDLPKMDDVHFDAAGVRTLGRRVMKRCFD